MKRRSSTARAVLAVTAALGVVLPLFLLAPRAEAVPSPVLRRFNPETLAVIGEGDPPPATDRIRATFVINHPVGVSVTGMRASQSRVAHPTAFSAVQGNVRVISGGSNYSVVEAAFEPGSGNWMGSACSTFGSDVRFRDLTARIDLQMSDGTVFNNNTWGFRALAIGSCSGPEDPATMKNNYDSTRDAVVGVGGTFRTHYQCDDGDSSGDDICDSVIISLRNAFTDQRVILQCSASTVPCENARQFNADDNVERNGTNPIPAGLGRGRWLVEGDFCSENQRDANRTTCLTDNNNISGGHQSIGSFYYNPDVPTVALSGAFTGGGTTVRGVLRPNTGATVDYTATTSADAQVAYWDLNDDGTFETVDYGETNPQDAPVLSAAQKNRSRSTVGAAEGSSCAVRIQVRDNGGINGADPSSRLSSVATQPCTVNRRPVGANVGPFDATKGEGLAITPPTSDGDGDPFLCAVVTGPAKGTVTTSGCRFTYTANRNTGGPDSFTYTVTDDHGGVSATYTVLLNIRNRAPVAVDQSVGTAADTPVAVTLTGSDPDGDSLTFTTGPASNGTVTGTGATVTYTPNRGFTGVDTFTFRAVDGAGAVSPAATVRVFVGVGQITGTVVDEQTLAGLAGVEVRVVDFSDPNAPVLVATAVTRAGGDYDVGAELPTGFVPTGTYKIRFVDPSNDHLSEWFDDKPTSTVADPLVVGNGTFLDVDAALTQAARITGTVRSTVGDTPISGIQVRLYRDGSPTGSSAFTTDANGSYRFELLTAGTYQLFFRDVNSGRFVSEYFDEATSLATATPVTATTGQQITIDESLAPTTPPPANSGIISGTVTSAGPGGEPVGGLQVRLYRGPSFATSSATTTSSNGQYSFTGLAPGSYKVFFRDLNSGRFISEYHADKPDLATADVVTAANGTTLSVNAALTPVAPPTARQSTVQGTVFGPDGVTPLAGVQVRLYVNGQATGSSATTTNSSGQYAFTGRLPGQYQLFFRPIGMPFVSEWFDDESSQFTADPVTLANGAPVTIDASLAAR